MWNIHSLYVFSVDQLIDWLIAGLKIDLRISFLWRRCHLQRKAEKIKAWDHDLYQGGSCGTEPRILHSPLNGHPIYTLNVHVLKKFESWNMIPYSAITCYIIILTCQIVIQSCQIFMLTCQIFMLTWRIFMLTCQWFICK